VNPELLAQLARQLGVKPDAARKAMPQRPAPPTIGPQRQGLQNVPASAPMSRMDAVRMAASMPPGFGDAFELGGAAAHAVGGDMPAALRALTGAAIPGMLGEGAKRLPIIDDVLEMVAKQGPALPSKLPSSFGRVPDELMGFPKPGTGRSGKSFREDRYPGELDVRLSMPRMFGKGTETWDDAIAGLNYEQALERARRNWPDADIKIEPMEWRKKRGPR
jgi:hypothetical protein